MRVLAACSLGGAGHLHPLVPLLDAARRAGADTLVVGPPALAWLTEQAGYAFVAGDEPAEALVAPIREQLPVAPAAEATTLAACDLFGRLAATAMLPAMSDVCRTWRPDVVLRDPCEYASAVVAPRLGIPTAQVAISLAEAEAGSIAAAAPALEEHRPGLAAELAATPYLTRFPASLDPSPFPDTVRFHDPAPASPDPLPDWWDGDARPLVYVTFGTVLGHLRLAEQVYATALDAVAELPARVLLTTGHAFDPARLDPPSNVHLEAWIDQPRVLSAAAVVVCHGGSGTAFGALAAGLPLVLAPVFADQFENSRRIAAAGAGLTVEPAPGPDPSARGQLGAVDAPRLRAAIDAVLTGRGYRDAAARLAAELGAAATPDQVIARFRPADPARR